MEGSFGDVITAMITPFTETGDLDADGIETLAEYLLEHGSDGLVVAGTTGESPTLSFDEKAELFRRAVAATDDLGRGKVIAGTSTYNTVESTELTRMATDCGVDGILAVTPYYNKPPQRGLIAHFTAIADATELPVLLYDIPGRTGTPLGVDTLAHLSAHPNILGVKDATKSVMHVAHVVAACGDDFEVYSGDDSLTIPYLSVGGRGVVSVASHVAGQEIAEMIRAFKAGDVEAARKRHLELLPLFEVLFEDASPIPVKAAVALAGLPGGRTRLPLAPPELAFVQKLRTIVEPFQEKT